MATPLPIDAHAALRKAAAGRERDPFPWLQLLLFIISASGLGWCYYHFFWQYRLPQERVLIDQDGKSMNVRIEERDGGVLRITSLADGSKQLFPVAHLSIEDQKFCELLAGSPPLVFPLNYSLKNPDGSVQQVTLTGYNEFFVDYTTSADPSDHYKEFDTLSELDQSVISTMEKSLRVDFPVDYIFRNSSGDKIPVHILGKSNNLIRYSTTDGTIHSKIISTLTKPEQDMVASLKTNQSDVLPVDFELTIKNGTKLSVILTSKNSDYIQYLLPTERETGNLHLYPISEIAPEEQQVIYWLRPHTEIDHSFACALTDITGRTVKVKVLSRTADMVKFIADTDNKTYDYPIASLSDMDKTFVDSLPAGTAVLQPEKNKASVWKLPELSSAVQNARLQLIDLDKRIVDLQNQLAVSSSESIKKDITDFNSSTGLINQENADNAKEIQYCRDQQVYYRALIKREFETRIAELASQDVEMEGEIRNDNLTDDQKVALQTRILKNVDAINLFKSSYTDVTNANDAL